jgi:hypothetical protein
MKQRSYFAILLSCAIATVSFPHDASAADLEPQVLTLDTPVYALADPFLISVTLGQDGTLSISPDWAAVGEGITLEQLQLPPTVRAISESGWLTGEVALADGTWTPVFSAPENSDVEEDESVSAPLTSRDGIGSLPASLADVWNNPSSNPPAVHRETIPAAPTNMRATRISATRVLYEWDSNSDNEDGFILEGENAKGEWVEMARVGPGVTSVEVNE